MHDRMSINNVIIVTLTVKHNMLGIGQPCSGFIPSEVIDTSGSHQCLLCNCFCSPSSRLSDGIPKLTD